MRTIRERMAADLKIAGYSESTAQIYLIYAGKFIDHYNLCLPNIPSALVLLLLRRSGYSMSVC